jgi:hypothetical protein
MSDTWAANTEISQPQGMDPDQPVMVDMGGFGFTTGGITHNITDAERQDLFSPFYAPQGDREHQ